MAVRSIRTTQRVSYNFGMVNQGVLFEKVINIGKDNSATVVVQGKATIVLPPGSYEIVEGELPGVVKTEPEEKLKKTKNG